MRFELPRFLRHRRNSVSVHQTTKLTTRPKNPTFYGIPVDSKAPDFSLKSKQGDTVSDIKLADFLGKSNVVLLFFPLAFTGVCTAEMCDIIRRPRRLRGAEREGDRHQRGQPVRAGGMGAKERIGITLASDLNKTTATAYGTLLADLGGFGSASARAAFVIDKAGVIQYSEQTPTPKDLPNFEAIKAKLAELK